MGLSVCLSVCLSVKSHLTSGTRRFQEPEQPGEPVDPVEHLPLAFSRLSRSRVLKVRDVVDVAAGLQRSSTRTGSGLFLNE